MSRDSIVIVNGARTPVGRGVRPEQIDEVIMGCIGQVGADAYNARLVALEAGLPNKTPAFTVNRLCGSGLQSIWSAAQQIAWGSADMVLAGGDESMSRMPFLDFEARGNSRLGNRTLVDGTIGILTDPFSNKHMGVTAERVAERYNVSREQQDEFALESQRRANTAAAKAAFAEEITPVQTIARKPVTVDTDEHPRPETTMEDLAALRPAFEAGGSVTAGNASGVNDGAAAVVVTRATTALEQGLGALATIEHVTTAALEPEIMGYAPVLALQKLFERSGLTPADIDTFEVNEAFASQAVAVIRDAGLDPEKTNPYGGAIALGHPVGATGTILTLRAAMDLQRRDLEYAVVTMCIGGGQALAALLRRAR